MIIDTNKKYKVQDILNFMSDLVSNRLSNGYKIDFEQSFYIRNCSSIEDKISETYIVATNDIESVLTYMEGDFDAYEDIFILERLFEPSQIDDVTFQKAKEVKIAKFKSNDDVTYSLEGFRFNL